MQLAFSKELFVVVVLILPLLNHHLLPSVQTHIRELERRHFLRYKLMRPLLLRQFLSAEGQRMVSGEDGPGIEAEGVLLMAVVQLGEVELVLRVIGRGEGPVIGVVVTMLRQLLLAVFGLGLRDVLGAGKHLGVHVHQIK
jgi:hypothetical protein